MTIKFPEEVTSLFDVGQRVKIDLLPFYKRPPYEQIEGTIYQVRIETPLMWTAKANDIFDFHKYTFRYGILADIRAFPRMKDYENELYDVPEEYLMAVNC